MSTALKKRLLARSGIYLVADNSASKGRDLISTISRSLEAGVDIVQFRDKRASDKEFLALGKKIKRLTEEQGALFVVNDRVGLALEMNSDGVHLGDGDMSVEAARKALGRERIIGFSTHSIAEMRDAAQKDADYISIGPVFATPAKPGHKAIGLEPIKTASRELRLPFVAIGGINESNVKDVVSAGAKRVAVIRAIMSDSDPCAAARTLIQKLE